MNILPRIKKYKEEKSVLRFPETITIRSDDYAATGCAENLIKEYYCSFGYGVAKTEAAGFIAFEKMESDKTGYYEISAVAAGISVRYSDGAAARNAAASIIALCFAEKEKFRMQCCSVQDFVDCVYRGFMMDLARQYYEISFIKQTIRRLALAKYNVLHLHLLDTERYALQTEILPVLNENPIFKQYSVEEMKDIVNYSNGLGIKVIPELDFPGHGLFVLEKLPDIKCRISGQPSGIWTMCVSNEKTYDYIELLVKELTEIFPDDMIHMGGDELAFYDLTDSGYWPEWEQCDTCKKLKEENCFADTSDLYCYFVRRVYDIVKRYNRRLMIWNDAVDISRSPELPRDILIHFWRVAYPTRGPHAGCSMQRFLEEGFQVINSHFPEAYADDYITEQNLRTWHPALRPKTEKKYHEQILGGELCAWGIREHYIYTLPALFCLFGDRLCNKTPNNGNETRILTKQVICAEADFPDVFSLLGGGLMPLSGDDKFIVSGAVSRKEVDDAIYRLSRLKATGRCDVAVITAYIRCLEDVRKTAEQENKQPQEEGKGV